ncbi:MAG: hypothetical protein ACUVWN_14425 [bacterium]
MKKYNVIFIFVFAFLFVIVPFIFARAFRLDLLPDKGKSFGCATCHINPAGGGALNAFGNDYQRIAIPAGDKYTDALANLDSDKDGFTNAEEFAANPVTKPWDANSFPPKKQNSVNAKNKQYTTWAKIKAK